RRTGQLLERDFVDFDDTAVRLEREGVALLLPLAVIRLDLLERRAAPGRIHSESEVPEEVETIGVPPGEGCARQARQSPEQEVERTLRRQAGIEEADRPGRGVARVGEERLPRLLAPAVHVLEGADRVEHLAARLQERE